MSTHNFLGLLDLKVDATIGLDGQLIMLKTNDFVGISGVDHGFHLVSIRPHPNASIVVGFLVFGDIPLIRKYDPQTEEVSSQEVDEMSTRNLLEQVRNGQLPAASVLDYKNIVSNDQMIQWRDQTKFILSSKILGRRGIQNGDKVIPGSYNDDDTSTLSLSKVYTDGKSVKYPSIPVVDTTISLKSNRHAGTRRYLTTLSPSERTQLFMESKIAGRLLRDILKLYFEDSWETLLGDLQLAYILFLYLQCLASLEHWKDLVAMLSLVEGSEMKDFPQLYHALLEVLPSQLSSMDKGFLEDVDEAGNNFLLPSLKTLCRNLMQANLIDEDSMIQFQRLLSNKFPSILVVDDEQDDRLLESLSPGMDNDGYDDYSDDDTPVVVDMHDIEASFARSSEAKVRHGNDRYGLPVLVKEAYPLLVAAIQPHEDILMTCARALDEKKDVSLVREAAAYLEEMEEHKS